VKWVTVVLQSTPGGEGEASTTHGVCVNCSEAYAESFYDEFSPEVSPQLCNASFRPMIARTGRLRPEKGVGQSGPVAPRDVATLVRSS